MKRTTAEEGADPPPGPAQSPGEAKREMAEAAKEKTEDGTAEVPAERDGGAERGETTTGERDAQILPPQVPPAPRPTLMKKGRGRAPHRARRRRTNRRR